MQQERSRGHEQNPAGQDQLQHDFLPPVQGRTAQRAKLQDQVQQDQYGHHPESCEAVRVEKSQHIARHQQGRCYHKLANNVLMDSSLTVRSISGLDSVIQLSEVTFREAAINEVFPLYSAALKINVIGNYSLIQQIQVEYHQQRVGDMQHIGMRIAELVADDIAEAMFWVYQDGFRAEAYLIP